ncbi:MAG: DNA-processing protein DprA [Sedimentibacter sp.]
MEYWIWLSLLKGIGPIIAKRLLAVFHNPENIFNADVEQLMNVQGIGVKTAKIITENKSLSESIRIYESTLKENIKILTCNNLAYESIAFNYNEMPIMLYYKGNVLNKPGVAIVGSRRCSSYGKKVVVEAAEFLASKDICVVSGMAKGIDGYAHTACINAGGYTIAFLGNGLDICYPKEHDKLMESIIESGIVISEYAPGVKARPEHFSRRNYLICSWSEKVLIVEASENSGALITANIAKNQGKKIIAVPSDIYSATGKGTNNLIYNGAEIYLNPRQLLVSEDVCCINDFLKNNIEDKSDECEDKNYKSKNTNSLNKRNLNEIETKIMSCLKDEEKIIDEISIAI